MLDPYALRRAVSALHAAAAPMSYAPHFMPPDEPDARAYALWEIEALVNAQSIGFMIEMLQMMAPWLDRLEAGPVRVLDVGARSAAGSALLASAFSSTFTRLHMMVDVIDLDPMWRDYAVARWPLLGNVITGDVFDLEPQSYDLVVCSHTLEHIEDAAPFARQLQRIAKSYAFFYCPFNEADPIEGHFTVSPDLIRSLEPAGMDVRKSWWWRPGADHAMQDCVFFVLEGHVITVASNDTVEDVSTVPSEARLISSVP